MLGSHNVYNGVGALVALYALGYDLQSLCRGLSTFPGVPGRLESIESPRGHRAFVDYSHTVDALKHAILSLQKIKKPHQKLETKIDKN